MTTRNLHLGMKKAASLPPAAVATRTARRSTVAACRPTIAAAIPAAVTASRRSPAFSRTGRSATRTSVSRTRCCATAIARACRTRPRCAIAAIRSVSRRRAGCSAFAVRCRRNARTYTSIASASASNAVRCCSRRIGTRRCTDRITNAYALVSRRCRVRANAINAKAGRRNAVVGVRCNAHIRYRSIHSLRLSHSLSKCG